MQSTEVRESYSESLASSSDASDLFIQERVPGLVHLLRQIGPFDNEKLRLYLESHAAQWSAQLREEQKSALRTFLSNACRRAPLVEKVLADFLGDTVDLVFVVRGDLYEGETQALSIMPRLRRSFPSYYFDVMVVPTSVEESVAAWRAERETLYARPANFR